MSASPLYRRVLFKASGEALMGDQSFGIDQRVTQRIAQDIKEVVEMGVEVGVVVGGGNIFRGIAVAAEGGDRVTGDHMGMLATVMNALSLAGALHDVGVDATVLSALTMPQVCETFTHSAARRYLREGRVVLFAGGTGNPYFTTDTGAALRAAEMQCDALFKATQVDGIYSADPKKFPDAERYDQLSYDQVITQGLAVMDTAAIALARENNIPVVVFSIAEPGAFREILLGGGVSTTVKVA
jgi:uridylate kinase